MSGVKHKTFACPDCPRDFTTKRRLLGHQENRHKGNSADGQKENCYTVTKKGTKTRYQCDVCYKSLSSKQRILGHLEKVHFKSPASKVYKKWNHDDSNPVPKTTKWRSRKTLFSPGNKNYEEFNTNSSSDDNLEQDDVCHGTEPTRSPSVLDNNFDKEEYDVRMMPSKSCNKQCDEFSEIDTTDQINHTYSESEQSTLYVDADLSISEISSSSVEEASDSENDSLDINAESSISEISISSEEENEQDMDAETLQDDEKTMSEFEMKAYCKYAFATKHHLSVDGNKDLSRLLKVCSDSEFEYAGLTSNATNVKIHHYCVECGNIFRNDPAINQCTTEGCNGRRYHRVGQPKASFVLADIEQQLTQLLEKHGIWTSIQETKKRIKQSSNDFLNDITDGSCYRQYCNSGKFLTNENHLSAIFNTDGIPLYSSSKVKLWPIFLAINELPVTSRFARENLLIAGIWQGKNNPPFFQYMEEFGKLMNRLFDDGIAIKTPGKNSINVKIQLLCGTLDLQAKAYVSNMTMHNGAYGCSTCEEPGLVVRQGKGHTRMYPYRTEKPHLRDSDDIKQNKAPVASRANRLTGICGMSGLSVMPYFNLITGFVPDYMHGVLLGTTKSLMYLWFSSTNSNKPFFIGNRINHVSKRLQNICPPDYVERLPRDLEKNFANFKATELQTWLLYYALPCLEGILPVEYLQHFCLLSEGIYLLLSDCITASDLHNAERLLCLFYQQFTELYPEGSCGLNVHNIGSHLVDYVRMWGPLWGWSCFPFEDANAAILDAVHGTGDITRQYLSIKSLEGKLSTLDLNLCPTDSGRKFLEKMRRKDRNWSSRYLKAMSNCCVAGALTSLVEEDVNPLILTKTGVADASALKKVLRVQVNSQKLYSEQYGRMKKRICHVVNTTNGMLLKIAYFVINTDTKTVYAVGSEILIASECFVDPNCPHVFKVNPSDNRVIVDVKDIAEKVFYMVVDRKHFVSRLCNLHGHSVFK